MINMGDLDKVVTVSSQLDPSENYMTVNCDCGNCTKIDLNHFDWELRSDLVFVCKRCGNKISLFKSINN